LAAELNGEEAALMCGEEMAPLAGDVGATTRG